MFPGTESLVLVTQAVLVRLPVEAVTVPVMLMVVSSLADRAGNVQVTTPLSEVQAQPGPNALPRLKPLVGKLSVTVTVELLLGPALVIVRV